MKRFILFGYYVAISREPFKTKKRDKKRNDYRNHQHHLRLEQTGFKCEVCGTAIDNKSCHFLRILPEGTSDRNTARNIRALCGECWHSLESKPHILAYLQLEDDTRYEEAEL